MSYYPEPPQTPHTNKLLQEEDEPNPSSSSGGSSPRKTEIEEQRTSLHARKGTLQPEFLVPSLMALEKGNLKNKYDASSSPFLVPVDTRSTSPLLLPHVSSDQAYLDTPSSYNFNSFLERRLPHKLYHFWTTNRSYLLVIISTFFGSLMTLLTKLLERDGRGMHAFQILVVRMAVSWVVCISCLYYTRRSEFPFGPKNVRWLLLMRGAFGCAGIGGLWTALSKLPRLETCFFFLFMIFFCCEFPLLTYIQGYLSLSDATVITFLTPSMIAGYSALFLGQPFPKKEMAASFVAMAGVVFIARPVAIFGALPKDDVPSVAPGIGDVHPGTPPSTLDDDARAASERLIGIILCLISAVGGAGALLSVKMIGTRASVLTTTSYFACISALVSTTILILAPVFNIDQPELHFALPNGLDQWLFVGVITVCGLATQLLMTLGVGSEGRSNKAPAMLYTGMLWTAGFDRWAFGKEMHWTSIVGICLIVGGALFMALQPKPQATEVTAVRDEEAGNNRDRTLELEPLNSGLVTNDERVN